MLGAEGILGLKLMEAAGRRSVRTTLSPGSAPSHLPPVVDAGSVFSGASVRSGSTSNSSWTVPCVSFVRASAPGPTFHAS